ncbi:hypothetical protein SAMN02745166_03570 [Prosthecobacter debontii]|uniref:Uncharacterized protein n=1 Tax=Prosthecobacter debontii TaxID=48467 RepID=A0A1T4YKV9_9BACT|nr:hypothetical protein SAMN02745166_03570 [Prosthecobacter debontii]
MARSGMKPTCGIRKAPFGRVCPLTPMDATPLGLPAPRNTHTQTTQGSENPGLRDTMPLALRGMQNPMAPCACSATPCLHVITSSGVSTFMPVHHVEPYLRVITSSRVSTFTPRHRVELYLRVITSSRVSTFTPGPRVAPCLRVIASNQPIQGQAQRACVVEPRVARDFKHPRARYPGFREPWAERHNAVGIGGDAGSYGTGGCPATPWLRVIASSGVSTLTRRLHVEPCSRIITSNRPAPGPSPKGLRH